MSNPGHDIARAFFAAVSAGELPDSLLTEDFSAWTTGHGDLPRTQYVDGVRMLRRICSEPIAFTIDAMTAENDRVLTEARSHAKLINGDTYANTYVFAMRIRDGRIAWVGEHLDPQAVVEKLYPVMAMLR